MVSARVLSFKFAWNNPSEVAATRANRREVKCRDGGELWKFNQKLRRRVELCMRIRRTRRSHVCVKTEFCITFFVWIYLALKHPILVCEKGNSCKNLKWREGRMWRERKKLIAKFNSFLIIVRGDDGTFGRTGERRQCWDLLFRQNIITRKEEKMWKRKKQCEEESSRMRKNLFFFPLRGTQNPELVLKLAR